MLVLLVKSHGEALSRPAFWIALTTAAGASYLCKPADEATKTAAPSYTRIPFGREVLSHCLHEVAFGAASEALPDGRTRVTALGGSVTVLPKCDGRVHPAFRFAAAAAATAAEEEAELLVGDDLPFNYDGWLSCVVLDVSCA